MGRTGLSARRLRLAGLLAVAALLTACAGSAPRASAPRGSPTPSASPAAELNAVFDVDHGRSLHLKCLGSGEPTVLFEAGGGDNSSTWPPSILAPLSERTRVCAYDRAGTGASDAPPNHRRMMVDVRADLDALLEAAHIDGRLLLVGGSFGGQVALDWALHNPRRTAGLVTLDTDWPTGDLRRSPDRDLSSQERADIKRGDAWNSADNREHIAYQSTLAETEAAFHTLPGVPIRILTAGQNPDCPALPDVCAHRQRTAIALQQQWLRLSPTAVRTVVDSGHVMQREVPELVLAEILTALTAAH